MHICKHEDWVEVRRSLDGLYFADPGRLNNLLSALPDPSDQFPQIVTCVGGGERREAIKQLFSHGEDESAGESRPDRKKRRVTNSRLAAVETPYTAVRPGPFRLCLEKSTTNHKWPLLFAECSLDALVPDCTPDANSDVSSCHQTTYGGQVETGLVVLTRLLFPFTDVILLFADDLGGVTAIPPLLRQWCTQRAASCLTWQARPRLAVITRQSDTAKARSDRDTFHRDLCSIKYHSHFSEVTLTNVWRKENARDKYQMLQILAPPPP